MVKRNPSRIGTIGASCVIFAITSRFATQAVQQRRKRRGIAFYALHVWIHAMLEQELYNVEMTTICRTV
jgi:ABC-type arginine transport system ATPase subunit